MNKPVEKTQPASEPEAPGAFVSGRRSGVAEVRRMPQVRTHLKAGLDLAPSTSFTIIARDRG